MKKMQVYFTYSIYDSYLTASHCKFSTATSPALPLPLPLFILFFSRILSGTYFDMRQISNLSFSQMVSLLSQHLIQFSYMPLVCHKVPNVFCSTDLFMQLNHSILIVVHIIKPVFTSPPLLCQNSFLKISFLDTYFAT